LAEAGRVVSAVTLSQPAPLPIQNDPGLDYLESLRGALDLAASAAGGFVEHDLEVAGVPLRLSCAGDAMPDVLLPPFEHLATEARPPELRIGVFDTASTGVEPPPLPWPPLHATPGANPVARFESDRVCVLAAAGTGALTAADQAMGEAVFHLPDASRIPSSERAAPLREALHLLMAPRRRWLTHAGAVGRDGRGALLIGRGGSGKSTLALSCALAGMEIVADDYVLLETRPPVAHAMQSTAKLTEGSAVRLGLGREAIDPAGFEPTLEGPAKALVEIRTLVPGLIRRRLEIGALIAPVVTDLPEPALEPISPAHGLRALAPSTILQTGSRSSPVLGALGELVRAAPSFELALCPDPAANATVVAELVDGLG